MEIIDDVQIWQNTLSKHEHTCLGIGVRFKIFDILKASNMGLLRSELIQKADLGKRGGEAVLAVLTSLKYLKLTNGLYYKLTDLSRTFLTSDSPHSMTSLYEYSSKMAEDETLEKALRADRAGSQEWEIVKMWENGEISADMAAGFTLIMQGLSKSASSYLANTFDLKKLGITGILDVAGGSGCYSIDFATKQPGVKAVVLDLPEVCKVAQKYIEEANRQNEVFNFACNMFKEDFPIYSNEYYGYNAVFLSQVLHDWDEKVCQMLCDKVYASLPPDGYILIHEALMNDDQDGPLVTALLSFDFFLTSNGGKQYSFAEIKEFLLKAGFKDPNVVKCYGIFSLIFAQK